MAVSGVSGRFQPLSRTQRQVPTRYSPVRRSPPEDGALDLHVLGAPPAFVLSQDQTLSFIPDIGWHQRSKPPPHTREPLSRGPREANGFVGWYRDPPENAHTDSPRRRLNIPSHNHQR